MREIKFRGKRIDNGEWVYGNLIYDNISDKYWIDLSINESQKIEGGLHIYAVEVIPETIGQYTGLHDKNGVEIYEGDIIELDEDGRRLYGTITELCKRYQLVGFSHGAFMSSRNKYIQDDYDTYLWIINTHCTVIGNTYDNPTLLKGE